MIKARHILAYAVVSTLITACASSGPKPIVQEPLKLSGPGDVKTMTCGEFGCDKAVKESCGEKTAQILDKRFDDQSTSRKNQTTGIWTKTKKQVTHYSYRCID